MRESKKISLSKERLRTFAASSFEDFINEFKITPVDFDEFLYKNLFDISVRNNNLKLSEWFISNCYVDVNECNIANSSLKSYRNISLIKESDNLPNLYSFKPKCIENYIFGFIRLKISDFKSLEDFLSEVEVDDKSFYLNLIFCHSSYKFPELYHYFSYIRREDSLNKILEEE